jgi:hypothetical protein
MAGIVALAVYKCFKQVYAFQPSSQHAYSLDSVWIVKFGLEGTERTSHAPFTIDRCKIFRDLVLFNLARVSTQDQDSFDEAIAIRRLWREPCYGPR